MMIWFLNAMFEKKRPKKWVYTDMVICVGILSALNIWAVSLFQNATFPGEAAAMLVMYIYLWRNMEGPMQKKALYSVMAMLIVMGVAVAFSAVLGIVAGDIRAYSSWEMSGIRFLGLVLTKLLCLLIYAAIIYRHKSGRGLYHLEKREWGFLILCNIFLYGAVSVLNLYVWKKQTREGRFLVLLCVLLLLIFDLGFILLLHWVNEKNLELWKSSALSERFQQMEENSGQESALTPRKLKHNLRNEYLYILLALREHREKEIMDVIHEKLQVLDTMDTVISLQSNPILGRVLSYYVNQLKMRNVTCQVRVQDHFQEQHTHDLYLILMLLLDNVVEYYEENPGGLRQVEIEIQEFAGVVSWKIKNTRIRPAKESSPAFLTWKTDRENHGMGLEIVKEIAKQRKGTVQIEKTEEAFCVQGEINENTDL